MKKLPFYLMMSFALAVFGCNESDVDTSTTSTPNPDEDRQTTGYRGVPDQVDPNEEDPDAAVILVDPTPLDPLPGDGQASRPPLGEFGTEGQQSPSSTSRPDTTGGAQQSDTTSPGSDQGSSSGPADENPAVEEEPASDLPDEEQPSGGDTSPAPK